MKGQRRGVKEDEVRMGRKDGENKGVSNGVKEREKSEGGGAKGRINPKGKELGVMK